MKAYRRTSIAILAFVCACVVLSTAQAARQRVPPGSYLVTPASTISELCAQIENNPKVSARFTKHFGQSSQQITAFLNEHVKLTRLSKAGRYTEYFIDVRGRMTSHVKLLPAGTPVLVLADGTPIMDMRCGNPMYKKLPKPIAKIQPVVETEEVKPVVVTPPPAPVVITEAVAVETVPPPPAIVEPTTQVLAGGPQEFRFSPAAGVLVLVPLLGGGVVTSNPPTPHNAIPELPAGALGLIGTALIAFPLALHRRR